MANSLHDACIAQEEFYAHRSLASEYPNLLKEWHPTRNGDVSPGDVTPGARQKVWWICEKGHEWQARVQSRTASMTGCPVCAGRIVTSGVNDLATANPVIASQWHPTKNGLLTPEQVAPYSNKKAWWLCEKGHEYRAVIGHRVHASTGCPYCSNRRVLAGFNDLETIHPAIAAQWHPELNGELTPQMMTSGSHMRVWWTCSEGHAWRARVLARTGPQKTGCPVCAGRIKESQQLRYTNMLGEAQSQTTQSV